MSGPSAPPMNKSRKLYGDARMPQGGAPQGGPPRAGVPQSGTPQAPRSAYGVIPADQQRHTPEYKPISPNPAIDPIPMASSTPRPVPKPQIAPKAPRPQPNPAPKVVPPAPQPVVQPAPQPQQTRSFVPVAPPPPQVEVAPDDVNVNPGPVIRGIQMQPNIPISEHPYVKAIGRLFGGGPRSAATAAPGQPVPTPDPNYVPNSPGVVPPEYEVGRELLIKALKDRNSRTAPQKDNLEVGGRARSPQDANAEYRPSRQVGETEYKDVPGKKQKDKPQKPDTEAKTSNDRWYDSLGVPRGDNTAAANAFKKLQAKQKSNPGTLTRAEDKILASSNKDLSYNKSIKEKDVLERFKSYQADEEKLDEVRKTNPNKQFDERFKQSRSPTVVYQSAPPQPQRGIRKGDSAVTLVEESIEDAKRKPVEEQKPDDDTEE